MVSSNCRGHVMHEDSDDPGRGDGPEEHGAHEQQLARHVRLAGQNYNYMFRIIIIVVICLFRKK